MTQNTVTHRPWAKIEFSTTTDPNVVHTSLNLPLKTLIGEAAEFPMQTLENYSGGHSTYLYPLRDT